jgi:uncharacterized membrane protein
MTETRHRGRIWRALRARPRLVSSLLFGAALWWLVPGSWDQHAEARVLVAWNAGALLYLALAAHMVWTDTPERMHRRALLQDEGRIGVLLLVVLAAAAVLLAVGSQLAVVKNLQGQARVLHIALAALTVVTSWLFTQTLLALHYAHDFYVARARHQADPLSFPGTEHPRYGDFFYFSCVIGTSGQTADVSFNGSALRGVGTLHCVLAFFFNATLLALSINIAAGLL